MIIIFRDSTINIDGFSHISVDEDTINIVMRDTGNTTTLVFSDEISAGKAMEKLNFGIKNNHNVVELKLRHSPGSEKSLERIEELKLSVHESIDYE